MSMGLDPATLFDSGSRTQDLATRSVRGGASSLGGQGVRTLVQMVGTVILARLLTPEDYGLVGMVTVVIGFAQMFKDAGLSMATVQQDEISYEQISTLFWVNLAVSACLAGVVFVGAPLVALFYGSPQLTAVTAALSVSFLISGVTIQHEALLIRHMRFKSIAVSQVAAQVVNVGVAITAALLGAGYWALVYGTLAAAAVSSGLYFYFCPWLPGRMHRGAGTRRMLKFGGDMMTFNFMTYFAVNSDYIFIGRFIGAAPLGLYTRAYNLFSMPVSQIQAPMVSVALPALSALRDDSERYVRYYRRSLEALGLLTVPIAAYCMLEADFIIRVLLGDQWMAVVPVFRLLAIGGLVQGVSSTRGLLLLSCGMPREYVRLGTVNAVVRIAGVLVGLAWGIAGVAAGTSFAILVSLVPSLHYFTRGTPVVPGDFYRALARPMLFGGIAFALGLLTRYLVPGEGLLMHLVVTLVFFVVYGALCYSSPTVRATIDRFVEAYGSRGPNSAPPAAGERGSDVL
jgi:PST family polysaccharide transporter